MNRQSVIVITASMLLVVIFSASTILSNTTATVLAVDPSFKEVTLGSTFTVDLNVSSVTDLYLWVATVEWNPSIVEFQHYSNGTFLMIRENITMMNAGVSPGKIDRLTGTVLGPVLGVSGGGSLAVFTFKAVALGTTPITITFSDLLDSNGNHIAYTAYGGLVEVLPQPVYPVANFTWSPQVPKVGETVTFDGSSSTPNGGTITMYDWDFGDSGKATGQVVNHVCSSKGLYTVTLNVTDSEGLWDIEQKQIQVIQTYTLAIYSAPTGITFTVDGFSHTTPWSSVYDEGTMPNLIMPDTYTVSSAKYLWNKWNDGVTSRSRTVTMNNDVSLTANYTGPYYQLTVTSTPITGIPFTINTTSKTTPYAEWLPEGHYTLEMPQTYNAYNWTRWREDGDINRIKTIYLHGTTWTGVYVGPPVGGEWSPIDTVKLVAPWITLASLAMVALTSFVYVRHKKKQHK